MGKRDLIELQKNRLFNLDILRIVSIFAMVLLHVASSGFYDIAVKSKSWQALNIYDSLVRWCVPVFVMISGYLLLEPKKNFQIKPFFTKNLVRMIVALAFWSFAYALYFGRDGSKIQILEKFVSGYSHLWFLFMIIGLYLAVPILRKVAESKPLCRYFLIIWALLVVLLPYVATIHNYFDGSIPYFGYLVRTINVWIKQIKLPMFLGYSGCFVLGYYLRIAELSPKRIKAIYFLGGLAALYTILGTSFYALRTGSASPILYGYLSPNVLLMAVAVFVLFTRTLNSNSFSERTKKVIVQLSNLCFGIYLIHIFVLELFQYLKFEITVFHPVFSIPVITVCVFLLSAIPIYIISKLPVLRKYII